MRKAQIEARRQRNRALAALDALHRCVNCKRNLREVARVVETFLTPGGFCSIECIDAHLERIRESGS